MSFQAVPGEIRVGAPPRSSKAPSAKPMPQASAKAKFVYPMAAGIVKSQSLGWDEAIDLANTVWAGTQKPILAAVVASEQIDAPGEEARIISLVSVISYLRSVRYALLLLVLGLH